MSPLSDATRPVLARDRRRRSTRLFATLTRWPLLGSALKGSAAAGLAYVVGAHLPQPFADAPYYAALGAYSVVLPAAVDSVRTALQTTSALLTGILIALLLQWVGPTDAITVAIAVGLGLLAAGIPWFGDARTWVPVGALFTLTVGGPHPQEYAAAYLGQILVGGVVGVLVNYLLIGQQTVPLLDRAITIHREELVTKLRETAETIRTGEAEDAADPLDSLVEAELRTRTAAREMIRARRGYPTRLQAPEREEPLLEAARGLVQCSAILSSALLLTGEVATDQEDLPAKVRAAATDVLDALATALDDPKRIAPDSEPVKAAEQALDRYLAVVTDARLDDERAHSLGALGIDARRALRTVAAAYGPHLPDIFGTEPTA
ncbi:hypothetical protein ACQP1U_10370 [Actinomycetota bacterium]